MKVKELIERLKRFDGDLPVAAYIEGDDISTLWDIDVPHQTTTIQLIGKGIKFMAPGEPDSLTMVLLSLDQAENY